MRVEVQDEPPDRVAETMLCGRGVDAGGDRRGRRRVSEAVERQPATVSLGSCRSPYAGAEQRVPQRSALRRDGRQAAYRVLFAAEGKSSQVLLALSAFSKKTQRTAPAEIRLAERRLTDWRARARPE